MLILNISSYYFVEMNNHVPLEKLRDALVAVSKLDDIQYANLVNELKEDLKHRYNTQKSKIFEGGRAEAYGEDNFAKTLDWISRYTDKNLPALEAISSALYALTDFSHHPGAVAWEMRRFIKYSNLAPFEIQNPREVYTNVPVVIEFGFLIQRICEEKTVDAERFYPDMDSFFYSKTLDPKKHAQLVEEELTSLRSLLT